MDPLLDELSRLYTEVDALFADGACDNSTECCRFGVTGREPYVTMIELSLIQRGLARRGGPLGSRRRALPITRNAEAERICPLLDRSGRCAVYVDRPLGCRTFFCSRARQSVEPARDELRRLVRRLQDLAARHAPGGELGRPLRRALEGR